MLPTQGLGGKSLAAHGFGPFTAVVVVVTQPKTEAASVSGADGKISMQEIFIREPEDLKRKLILKEDEEIIMVLIATINAGIFK